MGKPILCLYGGTCKAHATEWRFVPFVNAHDASGLVSAYCEKHLRDADLCGGRPVVSDHLPKLRPTAASGDKKGGGRG
jgi:hypothetical protein